MARGKKPAKPSGARPRGAKPAKASRSPGKAPARKKAPRSPSTRKAPKNDRQAPSAKPAPPTPARKPAPAPAPPPPPAPASPPPPPDPRSLALPPLGWPALSARVYAHADHLFPGGEDVLREILNDAAGALGPGSKALLIGDETARAAIYLARTAGLTCVVAGMNGPLMERAAASVKLAALEERVFFAAADLLDLGSLAERFGRGSFDAVIAEGTLHARGLAAGIAAARALVAPGGVLAFTALVYTRPPLEAHRLFWDATLPHDPPGTADDVMVHLGAHDFAGGVSWPLSRAHWERYHAPLAAAIRGLRAEGARAPLLDRLEEEIRVVHQENGAASIGPVCFVAQVPAEAEEV